jgi:hypothetical protein
MVKVRSRSRAVNEGDPASGEPVRPAGVVLNHLGTSPRGWSARDLTELYRVEATLTQSGLRVNSILGVTDEGDPWFVLCRTDEDEVILRFSRIGGKYVVSSPAYFGDAAGGDLHALVENTIERLPVLRFRQNDDRMALQLSAGFTEAARQAVRQAHTAGLAVPARVDGVAVEIRPDGEVVPIDDNAPWSPADWRKLAKR